MIKVFNNKLEPVAYLENAYGISYEKSFNEVWRASFSLPMDDFKNQFCKSLYFLEIIDEGKSVGMFRILPSLTSKSESGNVVEYKCAHVLSTLLDDVLFQYHERINVSTRSVVKYILDQQTTKHWVLGNVDITRYFHYKWENENLLSALFSVPKPFDVPYQWTWDTSSYPWVLNLVEPSMEAECEIRYAKNLKGITREEDPTDMVTRIYPLGYGEGVNQLTIAGVNPTRKPYIDAPQEVIQQYGLRSNVWVDRRFEDAYTLFSSANALLKELSTPKLTYTVDAIDLTQLTNSDVDKLSMGKVARIVDPDFGTIDQRIMKESKSDIKGAAHDVRLEIGHKREDLGTTQADLNRRIQINEIYAQGATNIDSYNYEDNCDPEHPAIIRFYIPEEMVRINKMLLSFESSAFRAYSKATKGGGGTTATSSSGGAATSSSGGGVAKSTASGGSSTVTSSSGGNTASTTTSRIFGSMTISTEIPSQYTSIENHRHQVKFTDQFDHSHSFSVPAHSHSVNIPAHTHNFDIPNHTHTVPDHTHDVTIPDHTHEILYGIFEGETPSKVIIKVDGKELPQESTSGNDINIIPYLSKDDEGKIDRGTWHTVEMIPDKMGRITANIATQLFLQSRGGGNF